MWRKILSIDFTSIFEGKYYEKNCINETPRYEFLSIPGRLLEVIKHSGNIVV